MARELTDIGQAFLSRSPPGPVERRFALAVVGISAILFLAAVPFAKLQLAPVAAFIPAYQSALVVCDLITAAMLLGQYSVLRTRALLALAIGFLFTAFMAGAHTLSFPGLFSPTGLLGAGAQTTAWLYMFWHGGFPCFVIAYAGLKSDHAADSGRQARYAWITAVVAAAVLAVAFTLLATVGQQTLPAIMQGNRYTGAMIAVVGGVWALSLIALIALVWRKLHSVLDLWLMVTMFAWVFDVALSAVFNAGRYDLGFYAGRIYGLLASSFVLVVLLSRKPMLYTRLIEASAKDRRRVTELERLSVELTQARADAEQASRAKSSFLAMMSHEIRTPMNGVIGMVEVLARSPLSEQQQDEVKTIRESATTLLGIIDDILDFSKIEAGRLQIEQAPLSLSDLVEGIANSMLPVATRRGVTIDVFVSPDIPERVLSDDVRLRQVLYNLIGNAIKFSGRQERSGRVTIRADVTSASPLRVAFSIADNGIGMSAETVDALFTPFTQAEQRRFGGSGLGLSISKRLVDMMDGEISVASEPGSGSTFTVTLPLAVPSEQPAMPRADLAGIDCLIVPSGDFVVDDVRVYLERAGADVRIVVDSGAAAHAAASTERIVVMIGGSADDEAGLEHALESTPNLRAVIIERRRQSGGSMRMHHVVSLGGNGLRRVALLRAVAVAAGRASPEIIHPSTDLDAPEEQAAPPSVGEARERGELILVVEDDEVNRKVIRQQLRLLGYAAEIADSAAEALQWWREGSYALVLTDLHMPDMDGYQLTEAIRREENGGRHIPILALTANALRGEAHRARAVGMNDYLTKPVRLQVLKAALDKWVPKRAERGSAAAATAPGGAGGNGSRAVDVGALRDLIGDDEDALLGLLSDYRASARRLTAEIGSAWAAHDVARVGAIAHKLKASSRSVGAMGFGELCARLESAGKAGNIDDIAGAMPQIEPAFAEVDATIAAILAGDERHA